MATPQPERGRLNSRNRADHPNADTRRCGILRPHPRPHPWGPIAQGGVGLAHWCPDPDDDDPTGGH